MGVVRRLAFVAWLALFALPLIACAYVGFARMLWSWLRTGSADDDVLFPASVEWIFATAERIKGSPCDPLGVRRYG
jgi:hypothetical protein